MIEIIRHGNTTQKNVCPECNCEFRYSKEDIKFEDLLTVVTWYIYCPECSEKIIIKRIDEKG